MYYRRAHAKGGSFFFTVNIADRSQDWLVMNVDSLRDVVRVVCKRHPFEITAMVVLPDHLHAVWKLPEGDDGYAMRWALIKAGYSRKLTVTEPIGLSRKSKRERGIWQRRYWEHRIRDETDLARHIDYIHYNPVKHGYVRRAVDWPHSSFRRYVERGKLTASWGGGVVVGDKAFGESMECI